MKILHISPTDIRYDNRILKEINSLIQIPNCEVQAFGIFDYEGQDHEIKDSKNIRNFRMFSKELKILPKPIRYFLLLLEGFIKIFIPSYRYKPSVIHCHDTLFLPIAVLVKYLCNSKLIYDAHELESNKNGQSKINAYFTLKIEKLLWDKIDALICVSNSINDWYVAEFGAKYSEVILNSPIIGNQQIIKSDNFSLRKKLGIREDEILFVYVGYFGLGRSIEILLESFTKMSQNLHIGFVGYGILKEKIEHYSKIYPNIHITDKVPHEKLVSFIHGADVGFCLIENVSLSDYYCLPNKLFEYIFAGVKVIASDFPELRNMCERYKIGVVWDEKVEDIGELIPKLNLLGKIDCELLYDFSWEFQEKKLISLYKNLIKSTI